MTDILSYYDGPRFGWALVYRLFPLVTCRKTWTNIPEQKPCLYYHMGRCPEAPCAGLADRERYLQAVSDVELFLSGRQEPLVKKLKSDMEAAAERLEFERAAKLRDQVNALQTIVERQKVVNTTGGDQDVMAVVADEHGAAVQMFFIRGGKLIGQEHFLLDGAARHQTCGDHVPRTSDAMGAVDRLCLHRWIPPGVEQVDVVGRGEVEAMSAGLQTDEEDRAGGIVLESIDTCLPVFRAPVEILIPNALFVERGAHEREKCGEL